ncbi:MAG: DUF2279 domain-containing protein [Cyclobacteriaceae bacterium]|nr:DUF2279 domain-containing protein [Cyclobacteriaceae bacterium]
MVEIKYSTTSRSSGNIAKLLALIIFLSTGLQSIAQTSYPDSLNRKKLNKLIIGSTAGYTLTMAGLGKVWYSGFDKQSFRFFDDSKEWYQVDKMGHFFGAYQISEISTHALRQTGLKKRKSQKIGALASFVMMSSIEVFDGYSAGYGASTSDLLANAMGASFFLGQQFLWDEIRIYPKFSFHTTQLANQRPEVLGGNFSEKLLKDYNGQTYWLSFDMDRFTPFPKWLNLAVGYGAHDFLFASKAENLSHGFSPYRQYYLSLDFDFSTIPTHSKALKTLIYFVNMIKLPSPTLEFSNNRVKAYALYF